MCSSYIQHSAWSDKCKTCEKNVHGEIFRVVSNGADYINYQDTVDTKLTLLSSDRVYVLLLWPPIWSVDRFRFIMCVRTSCVKCYWCPAESLVQHIQTGSANKCSRTIQKIFRCTQRCSIHMKVPVQARSQPARWGGSELGWVEHQAHPPLGHCPRDVINLKNAPTLGHSQAPPPWTLPVWRHPYSKGGTKLLKGGTKLLKGGTKLLKGGTKLLKGGTKLLKGGTKLLKGGTKSLGWATGGVVRPPRPPLATGLLCKPG